LVSGCGDAQKGKKKLEGNAGGKTGEGKKKEVEIVGKRKGKKNTSLRSTKKQTERWQPKHISAWGREKRRKKKSQT